MRLLSLAALLVLTVVAPLRAAEREVIDLWPEGVPDEKPDATAAREENERVWNVHRPTLTVFPAPTASATGTAVIICPGGGYARLSVVKEGDEIAQWLNDLGVTAFVLRYRLAEYGQPQPLRDALRAIRTVRSRAVDFAIVPDRIGIMGFSAGGHLAASASTLFDAPEGRTGAALDAVSGRPDFSILMYPVITMDLDFTHRGSRTNLLGEDPPAELVARWSLEKQVSADSPPAFIFHTQDDTTVPVANALAYFSALQEAGVAAELHVYASGPHGIGLRPPYRAALAWPGECESWMRERGWLEAR